MLGIQISMWYFDHSSTKCVCINKPQDACTEIH